MLTGLLQSKEQGRIKQIFEMLTFHVQSIQESIHVQSIQENEIHRA